MTIHAPAWAEVNLDAIAHNIKELRRAAKPEAELMAVVKANAYGHGALQIAQVALANGATRLAVARVDEGLTLRRAGIGAPTLVLGYTVTEELENLIRYKLTPTIYNLETAQLVSNTAARLGKKAAIHLKIDTGMGRLGFLPIKEQIREIISITELPNIDVEGIYTHFAAADCTDKSYTFEQFDKFLSLHDSLAHAGIEFRCRHAANSAAIIDLPDTHLDLVRAGIAMYGIYPSNEVCRSKVSLKPAMTLKARVAHVKSVPANTGISYGVTYRTPIPTLVATIPVGYADGYSRLLSSKGEVLIRGKRSPVIGRICMDQFMVDAGHIPDLAPGEEVVLLGSQDQDCVSADEIAAKIGTISYEVLCNISARVPRRYISNSK